MNRPWSRVRDPASVRIWARRTWVVGGAMLLSSAVVGVVIQPVMPFLPGTGYLGSVLFSGSLLVFAFGLRRAGSVSARRPLGTGALTGLAIWTPLDSVIAQIVFSNSQDFGATRSFGLVSMLVLLVLALIAVIQIARAGTVPRPWNWAPTWCLAAIALTFLSMQLSVLDATPGGVFATAVLTLDVIIRSGSAIFLGVLAIVLANRPMSPRTVSVFRSSDRSE